MKAGAIASEVPSMLPTITFMPRARAASTMASASVRPPHRSSLDIDHRKGARQVAAIDASLQHVGGTGMEDLSPSRSASRFSGSGCSISATPASTSTGMIVSSVGAREALVAVDSNPDIGPRCPRGENASASQAVAVQFELECVHPQNPIARSATTSGASAPIVQVVRHGLGAATPASCQAVRPDRAASRSHSAQSSALRAPPIGKVALQARTIHALGERAFHRLYRSSHGRRLAEIINARRLAPPLEIAAAAHRSRRSVRSCHSSIP